MITRCDEILEEAKAIEEKNRVIKVIRNAGRELLANKVGGVWSSD